MLEGRLLVEAVFRCALWRWFGVLFWFLLLGPAGALLYRLVSLSAQGEARSALPPAHGARLRACSGAAELAGGAPDDLRLALAGNFDGVLGAWRDWHAIVRLPTPVSSAPPRAPAWRPNWPRPPWTRRWTTPYRTIQRPCPSPGAGAAGTARCDEPGVAHAAAMAGGAGDLRDRRLGDLRHRTYRGFRPWAGTFLCWHKKSPKESASMDVKGASAG